MTPPLASPSHSTIVLVVPLSLAIFVSVHFLICLSSLTHVLNCSLRTVLQIFNCSLGHPCSSRVVLQVSYVSCHLCLDFCTSSWSSRTILPALHHPSSFPDSGGSALISSFQDKTSNFLLLSSFISLPSSLSTSLCFCFQTQRFSSSILRLTASASTGNLLEMQILFLYPR